MTHSPAYEPAFHSDDAEEVAGYRSLSALAIVGLLFGLASPLCIFWPLLMLFPILGALFSMIAWRRIETSDGALVGSWVAVAGLALSVISIGVAYSSDWVTRYLRSRDADAIAREWIDTLLAGEAEKAFKLTVDGLRRVAPVEPGMPAPAETPYERFMKHPIVAEMAHLGPGSSVSFVEAVRYEAQPRRQFVIEKKYLVTPTKDSAAAEHPPVEVDLTMQRSQLAGERRPRWLVAAYGVPGIDLEQHDHHHHSH